MLWMTPHQSCLMLKGVLDPVKEAAKLTDKQVWHNSVHQLAAGF